MADLLAGFRLFGRVAVASRAVESAEWQALEGRCLASLLGLAADQAEQQEGGDPCLRYVNLLRSVVASGLGHVAAPDGEAPERPEACGWRRSSASSPESPKWQPQGRLIGWVDGPDLYLESEAAFSECRGLADRSGDGLEVTRDTLHRRLKERGLLLSTDVARNKIQVRKMLGGVRRYVMHASARATLGLATGGPAEEGPRDPRPEAWSYFEPDESIDSVTEARLLVPGEDPSPEELLLGWLERGIVFGLVGDRLAYKDPGGALTERDRESLSRRAGDLVRHMRSGPGPSAEVPRGLSP